MRPCVGERDPIDGVISPEGPQLTPRDEQDPVDDVINPDNGRYALGREPARSPSSGHGELLNKGYSAD